MNLNNTAELLIELVKNQVEINKLFLKQINTVNARCSLLEAELEDVKKTLKEKSSSS